jgi:CRISPR-associated protein Cmr6
MYDSTTIKAVVSASKAHPESLNLGLLFEKYPPLWKMDGADIALDKPLVGFFNGISKLMHRNAAIEPLLSDHHERSNRLLENLGGRSFELSSNWRFVTGMGSPHPSENGFKWDCNLGVPYLPGSSVKGALKAWMKLSGKDDQIAKILGSPEQVGSVIFFDAHPDAKPDLEVDIINTHYMDYYKTPAKVPPADYLSPNPVYFLTVAPGTKFIFRIASRDKAVDLDEVEEYLRKTAAELGLGAKTGVGYGQFI